MKSKQIRMIMLIGMIFFAGLITSSVQTQTNKLQRLFHHRVADTGPVIELGQIVFYFSRMPTINRLKSTQNNEHLFFIASVNVDKTVEDEINRFNGIQTNNYKAQLEKVRGGLTLRLVFDERKVGLDWGNFITIKNEAGVGFRLYDNEYLKQLNTKQDSLLKMVSVSKKPRIVIDCGHGGTDVGAVGAHQIREKEVTLGVGLRLARLLQSAGNEVFLTRDRDITIALDERTSFANKIQADLLVSIHANSAANKHASGVETFCLPDIQRSMIECSLACADKQVVNTLDSFRNKNSLNLATSIQNNIVTIAKKKRINLVDRQVKRAVSQILAGSSMPAVLVEIGFLTNEKEAQWLAGMAGQHLIAQGIKGGIDQYVAAITHL